MKYVLGVHSKRYGLLDTQIYDSEKLAKLAGGRSITSHFHHDYYTIKHNDVIVSRKEYGYSREHVLIDFKCYTKCCRDDIGAWEISKEGFRFFVLHDYLVPSDNFLDLECGRYRITDKFREVGLIVRDGGLPPEYSTQHTQVVSKVA